MPKRTKVVQTEDAPTSEPTASPDVFDDAIQQQAAAIVQDAADRTVPDTSVTPAAEPRRQYQPDPMPLETVNLTADNGGPKARLYRSGRRNEVAVTFDEKPGPEHVTALRDAGFRWQSAEKAWTKPLPQEERWRGQADAEQVFRKIAQAIRTENGLAAEEQTIPR